jgi:AraC-like DNA-binding protein
MKISDINPHIRYAKAHSTYKNSKKIARMCYDCRVFYIEDARGSITVNGTKYNITNKTAIYLPPRSRYFFEFDYDDIKFLVLDFDLINDFSHIEKSFGVADENNFQPELSPLYELPDEFSKPITCTLPQVFPNLLECCKNFLQKTDFYREHSSVLLKGCLLEFLHKNTEKSTYSALCEQVITYIHENYENAELKNSEIAKQFNYHPYHLSIILKNETGKSMHQYLIHYRLSVAKNLLLTTDYDIETISWRCGFLSVSHFIKIFREQIGTTPKKYRNRKMKIEV